MLSAGERRSSTANTIFRDPAWRKKDSKARCASAPATPRRLGIADGGRAAVTTRRGQVEAVVEVTDSLQPRAHQPCPTASASPMATDVAVGVSTGVAPNELTAGEDSDWLAGTPWHKHVPARVEAAL